MGLHDQVPSVLTHGGDSESAILSTLATGHAHHKAQAEVIHPAGPVTTGYPKAVHKAIGEQLIVNSEEEHEAARAEGWQDTPEEVIQKEKPSNGYTSSPEPIAVKGVSPHPRHMHWDDPAEQEGTGNGSVE